MPICITCSTPVKNLYTTYSKADDRSLGKGVRLTQCPKCKRFADKYVEHDYVVLFIDLVLIKPQVYRHLLFNRLGRTDDKLDPSILRLGILLVLFDVYITWARIEKSNDSFSTSSFFSNALIITQYLFFLTLNIIATAAQHLTVRVLVRWFVNGHATSGSYRHDRQWSVNSLTGGIGTTTTNQHRDTSPNAQPAQRGSPSKSVAQAISSNQHPTQTTHVQEENGTAERNDVRQRRPSRTNAPAVINSNNNNTNSNNNADNATSPTSPSASGTGMNKTSMAAGSGAGPGHGSPSAISTALLVSSCTKLFPILLVIWPTTTTIANPETDTAAHADSFQPSGSGSGFEEGKTASSSTFAHRASNYIGWIVLLNNIEALHILLDCGYFAAGAISVAGVVSRWLVEGWILGLAGLVRDGGGFGDGPVSDVLSIWVWLNAWLYA